MYKNAKNANKSVEVAATVDTAQAYLDSMLAAFDSRAAYESSKNADNESIQAKLKVLKKDVNHASIAAFLQAASVNADFINRAERNNARFNIYSATKIVNVARVVTATAKLNHFTLAILKSAKAFKDAALHLSHKDAIAACSVDSQVEAAKAAKLVRYDKIVSANTASTQASSSLNALLQFNILREYRKDNAICYELNDNDTTQALIERCA